MDKVVVLFFTTNKKKVLYFRLQISDCGFIKKGQLGVLMPLWQEREKRYE
jgi:hypothetical protein